MKQSVIVKKKTKLSAEEKALIAFEAADSKKALDIVCLHVGEISTIADYFLICAASSTRQLAAVAEEIEKRLRDAGEKIYHIEGQKVERWLLMDFGEIVIHIFHEETRPYYDLERLWGDAPRIEFGKNRQ